MFRKEYEQRIQENYNKRFNKYKRFDRKKFNKFKEIFKPFGFGLLQDFYTFAYIMYENNIELKDYIEYVTIIKDIMKESTVLSEEYEKRNMEKIQKNINELLPKCPKCDNILNISKIKIPKGKRNIKGWRTYFSCNNENCFYEEYSKKNYEEVIQNLQCFKKDGKQLNINELLTKASKDIDTDVNDIIDPDIDNLFGININEVKERKRQRDLEKEKLNG